MSDEYYKIIEEKIKEKVNLIVGKEDITFEEYQILKSEYSRKEIEDLRKNYSFCVSSPNIPNSEAEKDEK